MPPSRRVIKAIAHSSCGGGKFIHSSYFYIAGDITQIQERGHYRDAGHP
jgi:hypothetical protein